MDAHYTRFFSCYTTHPDRDYAQAVNRLTDSMTRFGLDHVMHAVIDDGSWQANTQRKPGWIWDEMNLLCEGDVLCWVDADAQIISRPDLILREWVDAQGNAIDVRAVRWERPERPGCYEVLSGTVALRCDAGAYWLVKRWTELCAENPNHWDQQMLGQALEEGERTQMLKIEWLPEEYCWIWDTFASHWPKRGPVIEHYQMSRRTRFPVHHG